MFIWTSPEDAECNPHPHQRHIWESALSSSTGLKCSSLEHQFKTWLTLVVPRCSMSPFRGTSMPEETPLIIILFGHRDGSLISGLQDLKDWTLSNALQSESTGTNLRISHEAHQSMAKWWSTLRRATYGIILAWLRTHH